MSLQTIKNKHLNANDGEITLKGLHEEKTAIEMQREAAKVALQIKKTRAEIKRDEIQAAKELRVIESEKGETVFLFFSSQNYYMLIFIAIISIVFVAVLSMFITSYYPGKSFNAMTDMEIAGASFFCLVVVGVLIMSLFNPNEKIRQTSFPAGMIILGVILAIYFKGFVWMDDDKIIKMFPLFVVSVLVYAVWLIIESLKGTNKE